MMTPFDLTCVVACMVVSTVVLSSTLVKTFLVETTSWVTLTVLLSLINLRMLTPEGLQTLGMTVLLTPPRFRTQRFPAGRV